jgi:hypothetical protein
MRSSVNDLREDLTTNDYWACDSPEATEDEIYAYGADDGLGGEAGSFAASWTPGVALAVADWLDAVAAKPEELRDVLGVWSFPTSDPEWQAALKTARAYLGEAADA